MRNLNISLGVVVEPARLLDRRAAAEVELAAGDRRRTAAGAGPLEDEHVGTGAAGLDGDRGAGAAEADDDHVGDVVPVFATVAIETGGGVP